MWILRGTSTLQGGPLGGIGGFEPSGSTCGARGAGELVGVEAGVIKLDALLNDAHVEDAHALALATGG